MAEVPVNPEAIDDGESDKQRAAQPRKHDEQHAAALDKVTDYVEEQLISLNINWKVASAPGAQGVGPRLIGKVR